MGKIGFMLLGGVIAILGLGILILICMLASWISDKRIMHKINKKNNLNRQLAEAKEIIYDFYDSCKGNGTTCVNTGTRFINFLELVKKAEAFLNSEVEK